MTKIEIRRMVTAAAAVCEDKKAERISILELDPADSGLSDYFLICSGSNTRQNQAIASGVEDAMKREFGAYVNSIEGYRQGEWILLDYVDFVVHIFSEDKREFYDIERLRRTAITRDLAEMKALLREKITAARKKQAAKKAAVKKSPAKKIAIKKAAKKTAKSAAARVPAKRPSKRRQAAENRDVKGRAKTRKP